jgi:hypothetical protein
MRTLLIVAALTFALPVAGQPYRWVDAEGRVQYSDRPPAGNTKATPVKSTVGSVTGTGSSGGAAAPAAPKSVAEQEQAFRKRLADKEEASKKQAELEAERRRKSDACDQAKRLLVSLEQSGRQVRFEPNGERTYLSDAEIDAERVKARSAVAASCK